MIKRLKTRDLKHNVYITYSGVSVNNFCAISSLGGGDPPPLGGGRGPHPGVRLLEKQVI